MSMWTSTHEINDILAAVDKIDRDVMPISVVNTKEMRKSGRITAEQRDGEIIIQFTPGADAMVFRHAAGGKVGALVDILGAEGFSVRADGLEAGCPSPKPLRHVDKR